MVREAVGACMLHNFTLDEDTLFAGQQYRAGWIVARGHWYNLRQVSERGGRAAARGGTFAPTLRSALHAVAILSAMPFCSSGDVCRESHDLPEGSGLHRLLIGTSGPHAASRSNRPVWGSAVTWLGALILI